MSKAMRANQNIEKIGLFISILAIAIPTYFSIKSEQTKELSVAYESPQRLLDPSISSTQKLTLVLSEKIVTNPWMLNIKIKNTGAIPIKSDEIEQSPTFTFKNSKIISASLIRRTPENIASSVDSQNNNQQVTINHKLMNPGDELTIGLVLDGPIQWPSFSQRISGISRAQIVFPGTTNGRERLLRDIPNGIRSVAAFLSGTIGALFLFITSIQLYQSTKKRLAKPEKPYILPPSQLQISDIAWRISLHIPEKTLSPLATIANVHIRGNFHPDWLSNPNSISQAITQSVPSELAKHYSGETLQSVAEELKYIYKKSLPAAIASHYQYGSDFEYGERLFNAVANTSFDSEELSEYLNMLDRLTNKIIEETYSEKISKKPSLNFPAIEIMAFILIIIISSSILLSSTLAYLV